MNPAAALARIGREIRGEIAQAGHVPGQHLSKYGSLRDAAQPSPMPLNSSRWLDILQHRVRAYPVDIPR